MIKKIIPIIVTVVVLFSGLGIASASFQWNVKDYDVLVFQFGKVVDIKETEGVYFTIPFVQSSKGIFVGERLYDIPTTTVTTLDKKTMICNAYVTWKIVDTKTYYSRLNSAETAQSRIDTSVYSAMKNVISSKSQDDIISGKDGSLNNTILEKITNLSNYGIQVTNLEIKVMDLPDENKSSVYERMISERNTIAAQYTANGNKEYNTKKSETDAKVREIKSNAEAEAAKTIAEGEEEYYKILAEAYSKSKDKTEFYKFWISLDALERSLSNGGTYVVDENSPLYEILINSSSTSNNNNQ